MIELRYRACAPFTIHELFLGKCVVCGHKLEYKETGCRIEYTINPLHFRVNYEEFAHFMCGELKAGVFDPKDVL